MKQPVFYRNIYARDNLELFLVSAVTSLLLLRFFLFITGYPQVGGETLHIAHMLYGGLLMMAAIVMTVSLLGRRIQRQAAFIGGVGFGIFIDQLGKFITQDNDYFFRPTIGIIYAIFITLYLIFNFLGRTTKFSSVEYQLNALQQLEEAVQKDLDKKEQQQIKHLLSKAHSNNVITQELKLLVSRLDTVPSSPPSRLEKILRKLDRQYKHFWGMRNSNQLVGFLFLFEALLFIALVAGSIVSSFDSVQDFFQNFDDYGKELIIGQLLASLVAAGYAILGVIRLPSSRLNAFEQFRRATLVNLFLTEFFLFSRVQFEAMPSFTLNLILFMGLHYAITQEKRAQLQDKTES